MTPSGIEPATFRIVAQWHMFKRNNTNMEVKIYPHKILDIGNQNL